MQFSGLFRRDRRWIGTKKAVDAILLEGFVQPSKEISAQCRTVISRAL
jgi:hypothetical protein